MSAPVNGSVSGVVDVGRAGFVVVVTVVVVAEVVVVVVGATVVVVVGTVVVVVGATVVVVVAIRGRALARRTVAYCPAALDDGDRITHATDPARKIWVQVVHGTVEINGEAARAGDGLALEGENEVEVRATSEAEVLLFDMVA